jgi:hypothetical protein
MSECSVIKNIINLPEMIKYKKKYEDNVMANDEIILFSTIVLLKKR